MNAVLLYSNHRYVSATHVAMFGLLSIKNRNVIIVCRYHSTVKNYKILVNIYGLNSKALISTKY